MTLIKRLLIVALLFIYNGAFGNENFGVKYFQEKGANSETNEHVQGLAIVSDWKLCDGIAYCQVGLSLNEIRSEESLNVDNAKKVYPLYLYVGVSIPTTIAPFVESGIDFGSLVTQEELNENTGLYASIGLRFSPIKHVSIAAYYKHYRIANYRDKKRYNSTEDTDYLFKNKTINTAGARFTLYFE